MFAIFDSDLVIGRTTEVQSHGVEVDQSSYFNLRFDGSDLVDISTLGLTVFYVDSDGVKHIVEGEGWQELECHYDDVLVLYNGLWRVRTEADDYDDLLSAALGNRATAYKSESDPLYIEWQYDQSDEGETKWRAKVLEIKERYPLPVFEDGSE